MLSGVSVSGVSAGVAKVKGDILNDEAKTGSSNVFT